MTVRNISRPIARVFLHLDPEMNCSEGFTPRPWLWSTVRWGALDIEFSSP